MKTEMCAIWKNRMHQTLKVVIIFSFLAGTSCRNNPVGPNNASNNFSVKVDVKDSNGHPVQGIQVSAYSNLNFSCVSQQNNIFGAQTHKSYSSDPLPFGATSTLAFQVQKSSMVTYEVYELDGSSSGPLVNRFLQSGLYTVTLFFNLPIAGTRVYKFVLSAVNDTTQQVSFKDSIYMTLWCTDPQGTILGYTSNAGTFETSDSLSFPNILTLPPMIQTLDSPDSLGTFSFLQNVSIVLTDPTTLQSMSYSRQIQKGLNEFNLEWNPSANASLLSKVSSNKKRQNMIDVNIQSVQVVAPPVHWKLSQNYPNPFY